MPTLTVNHTPCTVSAGTLLRDALPPHATPEMPCGGLGLCGKCRVVAQGDLSAPSPEELRLLTQEELLGHVRLACHTRILGDGQVTVAHPAGQKIQADSAEGEYPRKPLFRRYGISVDVGTTTLAARLYGGEGLLAQASALNPQARYGGDVISRVGRALEGETGLTLCIRAALSALVEELAAAAHIPPTQVDALVITGNTAMLYLLVGRTPDCLAHAPFVADTLFDLTLSGGDLDLPCPGASVYLPPCISAFLGADITTAVLASGLCHGDETALLADIGTNGELALWHKGGLLCCSTAAGPAFEGAGLSMGMPGKAGAIDHVTVRQGALTAHVLGDVPPTGICGSGVIDGIAALLETGQMDETGQMEGSPAVIAHPVVLTQKDVRMLQLAKSAVRSGIDALLHSRGLSCTQVSVLAIAGGFGSYLDVRSAAAMGLIPPELAEKARILGNAALAGASMLLNNTDFTQEARALAERAQVLDLNQNPFFSTRFVENMMF